LLLARESAEHASELAGISGKSAEPWHRTSRAASLRNVVYGFNDGLTANFGLVAGVIGATARRSTRPSSSRASRVSSPTRCRWGRAAISPRRASGGVRHEIAMERDEIALMPEVERDELALIYERRDGAESAMALATQVMADPQRMLEEQVQEELGISDPHMSPLREGWVTGLATAFGAVIRCSPSSFCTATPAIVLSFVLSMASHFLVGAARSVFTGRGCFRSGSTCSSSAWASPSWATSWATGSATCSDRRRGAQTLAPSSTSRTTPTSSSRSYGL
jgi:VIT1/CCC1 family predicted Fe2+/Mn2+ transporter